MTPRDAFLQAVIEDRDSDLPRLVFADWLDENGDEAERAWAEFIRLRCALSCTADGVLATCRDHAESLAVSRDLHLLYRYGRQWLPKVYAAAGDAVITNAWWSRGFVRLVELNAADWLSHADAVLAATPLEEVVLATWPVLDDHYDSPNSRFVLNIRGRRQCITVGRRDVDAHGRDDAARVFVTDLLRREWPGVAFTLPARGEYPPDTHTSFSGLHY